SLAGVARLAAEALARGLRVLLAWVPNPPSDRPPWFVESRSSRSNPKRGWYVWRDPAAAGGPPNNWLAAFPSGSRAWTLDPATRQYYLHCFLREQPDLDWWNPEGIPAIPPLLPFCLHPPIARFPLPLF